MSNSRIHHIDERGRVRLGYKDYRDQGRKKEMVLEGTELIRRFLQHILPNGFMRVRHYGFLANCCRKKRLKEIRKAIDQPREEAETEAIEDEKEEQFNGYPCPKCKQGRLMIIGEIESEKEYSG